MGYENFFATPEHAQATVRPENLQLIGRGETLNSGAHNLPAVITQIAYRGVDVMVRATATDSTGTAVDLLASVRADSGATSRLHLEPGAEITAAIRPADLVPLAD